MRFRLEWLGQYLPGELPDPAVLRRRLTDVGFIGEGVEGSGPEAVVDVEVTPNRPDAMNHRGMAREAAVALGREFRDAELGLAVPEGGRDAAELASVTIEDRELCSRYSSRVVEGIAMGPAPRRVAERLAAIGVGVISGPVDATNHVLWDVGQPLHAFDLDKLAKDASGRPAIVVRRARAGERLVTLDGVERALTPEMLVIADPSGVVALAGVMGGLSTAISASTTRILLESAHFASSAVRKTARLLGMHTDASHRFERGTDPAGTVEALARASRLIVEACGGTVAKGVVDVVARAIQPRVVTLRFPRVERFLGMPVPRERALAILGALGLACRTEAAEDLIEVSVPAGRVDLLLEVDLIEEVIRHVGYGALPETLPAPFVPTRVDPVLAREEKARDILAGAGFFETQTYTFVSSAENAPFAALTGEPVALENPLGEPFEILRSTPAIGLLKVAGHNVRHGTGDLSIFELGRAFGRRGGAVAESRRLAFLLLGARGRHFSEPARKADFFDGSGVVSRLFSGLGVEPPRFAPASLPFLAPGRAAWVRAEHSAAAASGSGSQDPALGWVGVLSADLCKAWDLDEPVVASLDLQAIPAPPPVTSVEAPPRFPGSDFDLTVTHATAVPFRELEAAARRDAPAELVSVDALVRYQGAGVAPGFVKTSIRLRFRSAGRSLSREELSAWRDQAAARLLALGGTSVDGYEKETP